MLFFFQQSSQLITIHFDIIMKFFLFSPKFGKVISLQNKDQFLDAVDKENPNVIVVVHLYSEVTSF